MQEIVLHIIGLILMNSLVITNQERSTPSCCSPACKIRALSSRPMLKLKKNSRGRPSGTLWLRTIPRNMPEKNNSISSAFVSIVELFTAVGFYWML